jgi:Cas7 group CRISPR-associated protein Csh2
MQNEKQQAIRRATGLLVIEVRNCNPNGDPDRESDPRQRVHDQRGIISGVSFKRKMRDLIEKKGEVWEYLKKKLTLNDEQYHVLESRNRGYRDIRDAADAWREVVALMDKDENNRALINRYWDARLFGATFLEKGEDAPEQGEGGRSDRKHIRTGVAQFGLGVSIAPVRIHRDTTTKKASAQESKDRGMAPLAMRYVEHGVYVMPFFINPTAAVDSGCTRNDVELMLNLVRAAYGHSPSNSRQMVEVRHAWYGEHTDPLCSFSEFRFIEAMMPRRKPDSDREVPSTDQRTLEEQYEVPKKDQLPDDLKGKVANFCDLITELPEWCQQ